MSTTNSPLVIAFSLEIVMFPDFNFIVPKCSPVTFFPNHSTLLFFKSIVLVVCPVEIKIDRTKFDIKYGSGSFFENLGDKMIYDDFIININPIILK